MTTRASRPESYARSTPTLRVALGLATAATLIALLVMVGSNLVSTDAVAGDAVAGDYAPWVDGP